MCDLLKFFKLFFIFFPELYNHHRSSKGKQFQYNKLTNEEVARSSPSKDNLLIDLQQEPTFVYHKSTGSKSSSISLMDEPIDTLEINGEASEASASLPTYHNIPDPFDTSSVLSRYYSFTPERSDQLYNNIGDVNPVNPSPSKSPITSSPMNQTITLDRKPSVNTERNPEMNHSTPNARAVNDEPINLSLPKLQNNSENDLAKKSENNPTLNRGSNSSLVFEWDDSSIPNSSLDWTKELSQSNVNLTSAQNYGTLPKDINFGWSKFLTQSQPTTSDLSKLSDENTDWHRTFTNAATLPRDTHKRDDTSLGDSASALVENFSSLTVTPPSRMLDSKFIAELDKQLGKKEANANTQRETNPSTSGLFPILRPPPSRHTIPAPIPSDWTSTVHNSWASPWGDEPRQIRILTQSVPGSSPVDCIEALQATQWNLQAAHHKLKLDKLLR